MANERFGRERIRFFEIIIPRCANDYGDAFQSPTGLCQAILGTTGTRKCYKTRVTCQDAANYTGTDSFTLRFAFPQPGLLQYGYVLPMIQDLDVTAGALNLAGMDENMSALGIRERVSVRLIDAKHDDQQVDPYRLERISGAAQSGSPTEGYQPYDRGTFWGKFLARHPYFSNYRCRVREGYVGQALDDMTTRSYILDKITGPNNGQVEIVAKDLFSRLEERKAVAPAASTGELNADITAAATSCVLSEAGIGDTEYPIVGSPGEMYIAIGDEVIYAQRSAETFTFQEHDPDGDPGNKRGALGTTAAAHDQDDVVQLVLGYEAQLAKDIIYDLLTVYGGIDVTQIDSDEWTAATSSLTTLYTGYICEPTPVAELVGELCVVAGVTVWHDTATDMIKIAALTAGSYNVVVDDDDWIKEGSLSVRRQVDRRITEAWIYYGMRNRKKDLDERGNFASRAVVADLDAEADEAYGQARVLEIKSRWIPQFGRQAATDCGERILSLFRNPPLEAVFALHHSRGDDVALGDFVGFEVAEVQDVTGSIDRKTMALVEVERDEHELRCKAQEINFFLPIGSGDRNIPIENDSTNLNLREIHDSQFSEPPTGSPTITVTFTIEAGVTIGSTTVANPAIRTGDWSDIDVLLVINVAGEIDGRGGVGGAGGTYNGSGQPGSAGGQGGTALLVEAACTLTGTGKIRGGGGGGGGGAGLSAAYPSGGSGGGGGGGAGVNGGSGGAGGVRAPAGAAGSTGTQEAGGAGGVGGGTGAGTGGTGGAPGTAGSAGGSSAQAAGGAGGSAGNAIDGVSLVTFTSPDELEIAGNQIN